MNTSKEIFARYIMTVFTDGSVSTGAYSRRK